MENLELRLKKRLVEIGLTAKELVAKIGMTENGFAYSIKNETIKLQTLKSIADVLDVPITYFFEEENTKREETQENKTTTINKSSNNKDDKKIVNLNYQHEIEKLKIKIDFMERELKIKDEMIEILKAKK